MYSHLSNICSYVLPRTEELQHVIYIPVWYKTFLSSKPLIHSKYTTGPVPPGNNSEFNKNSTTASTKGNYLNTHGALRGLQTPAVKSTRPRHGNLSKHRRETYLRMMNPRPERQERAGVPSPARRQQHTDPPSPVTRHPAPSDRVADVAHSTRWWQTSLIQRQIRCNRPRRFFVFVFANDSLEMNIEIVRGMMVTLRARAICLNLKLRLL